MNDDSNPEERLKKLQETFYLTFINFFSGGTYSNVFLGLFDSLNESLKKANASIEILCERIRSINETLISTNKNITNADESSSRLSKSLNWITFLGVCITFLGVAIAAATFYNSYNEAIVNKAAVISQRPYLDLLSPRIELVSQDVYQLFSEIENVGNRPAGDINIEFYPIALSEGNSEKYIFNPGWCDEVTQLSHQAFPHKTIPGVYASGAPQFENSVPLKYALVRISYADSILGENYAQIFYYQWIVNSPLIQITDHDAKAILDKYLKEITAFCHSTLSQDHPLSEFWSTISNISNWDT